MHIGHKALAPSIQAAQEGRFLAVATIHGDVAIAHAAPISLVHHFQCQLGFGAIALLRLRDGRLLTPLWVRHPRLRQIQAAINQTGHFSPAQGGEHANLAVVHLAEAAIPLPRHAGGSFTLLGEAAFVQDEHRIVAAQQGVGIRCHNSLQPGPVHALGGEHVLHGLMIGRVDFAHAQHVAAIGLEQAAHVGAEGLGDVAGAGDEKTGKSVEMGAKRFRKPCQGLRQRGRVNFTGPWSYTVKKQWLIVSSMWPNVSLEI